VKKKGYKKRENVTRSVHSEIYVKGKIHGRHKEREKRTGGEREGRAQVKERILQKLAISKQVTNREGDGKGWAFSLDIT